MENYNITSEQNVQFDLQIANFGERLMAYILDTLVILAFVFICVFTLRLLDIDSVWVYILLGAPALFYHVLFEIFWEGQSLGKKWRKIRVVRMDGGPETLGNAVVRFLLRPIDGFYGLGVIFILATKSNQRLGDLAAGTCIIHTEKQIKLDSIVPKSFDKKYQPKFPGDILNYFNDREINTVRKILKNRLNKPSHNIVKEAAEMIKTKWPNHQSGMPPYKFLDQLIRDYDYYVQKEFLEEIDGQNTADRN